MGMHSDSYACMPMQKELLWVLHAHLLLQRNAFLPTQIVLPECTLHTFLFYDSAIPRWPLNAAFKYKMFDILLKSI